MLAISAFKGQQTNEPEDPYRKNNLWEPIPGDHGVYGDFGEKAKNSSFTLFLSKNRRKVFIIILILAGILLWLILK